MYVSFLRGINVSGKNKIVMAELVEAYTTLGYTHVKSYLNTGNVVFNMDGIAVAVLEQDIKMLISTRFGLEIEVIVKSETQLNQLVNAYPFESSDGKNRYITMLKSAVDHGLAMAIDTVIKEGDQYLISDSDVNLYIPTGYGKTKITNTFIEKKSNNIGTTRNVNTLEKLQVLLT